MARDRALFIGCLNLSKSVSVPSQRTQGSWCLWALVFLKGALREVLLQARAGDHRILETLGMELFAFHGS